MYLVYLDVYLSGEPAMTITKKTLKQLDAATRKKKVAYLVRVEGPRDPKTGNRVWLSKQVRTMAEARKLERAWQRDVDQGTSVALKSTTMSELLDSWLATKAGSISPNSHRDYEIAVRLHLKPSIGTVPMQRLAPERVQEQYAAWQAAGMSPRMIHRCHIVLSQTLAQAVRFGTLTRNVAADVTKPSLSRPKPNVWTPGELTAFLNVAKADALGPLWYLLALEGMRRGEALGLRWADVNWERGAVHISQTVAPDKSDRGRAIILARTKTHASARSVRLTKETLAALVDHRDRQRFQRQATGGEWQDHDLIVSTSLGTPINPNNVTRSYNRLVILSGVPRIRVHDLRHTAATMLLRVGVPAKIVSERLGHASVGITMDLYSHVTPDMQDEAALAVSAILSKAQALA